MSFTSALPAKLALFSRPPPPPVVLFKEIGIEHFATVKPLLPSPSVIARTSLVAPRAFYKLPVKVASEVAIEHKLAVRPLLPSPTTISQVALPPLRGIARPAFFKPEAIREYATKLHHVRLRKILEEVIDKAHDSYSERQEVFDYVESSIKPILDRHGVVSEHRLGYYTYALALYSSQLRLKFRVDRIREHRILRAKALRRGLDPTILDEIDERLVIDKVAG